MSAWIAFLLLTVAGVVLLTDARVTIWGLDSDQFAMLAGSAGLVFLVGAVLGRAYRGRAGAVLRAIVLWTLVGLAGLTGYTYRFELGQLGYRIAGEFGAAPPAQVVEQTPSGARAVRIRRRGDGHFVANITINGGSVPMLVDTGASTVVLRQADARKLGIDTTRLRYTVPVQTANGVAYAAHVRLRTAALGPITVSGVDALVAQPGALKESLLGMSFLSRLRSYEFQGNFLTFRN